jgi:hypothetical protein
VESPEHFSFEKDVLEDEEIDSLFMRLEELEPPDDFVQQMLRTFSRLPVPQTLQEESKEWWDDSEGSIIRHEPKSSS